METLEQKRARAQAIFEKLKELHPDAKTPLSYSTPFELLVAVILSAQCTDERVNKVTPALFERFKSVEDFANAEQTELEKYIYSTGFYRNKAKNIIATAKKILADYKGKVPDTMEELTTLPGVARKTANVVLSEIFGKNEGFVVDTHVTRLANRYGFTTSKDPKKIEQDMMKLADQKDWRKFALALIFHGRRVCTAKGHTCTAEDPCVFWESSANWNK